MLKKPGENRQNYRKIDENIEKLKKNPQKCRKTFKNFKNQ